MKNGKNLNAAAPLIDIQVINMPTYKQTRKSALTKFMSTFGVGKTIAKRDKANTKAGKKAERKKK